MKRKFIWPLELRMPKSRGKHTAHNASNGKVIIGPLEREVLAVLSCGNEVTVNQAKDRLDRNYAYTTVMTTLDRLYRKGLLKRRMRESAYRYSLGRSAVALEKQIVNDLVEALVVCRRMLPRELATTLLQAFEAK